MNDLPELNPEELARRLDDAMSRGTSRLRQQQADDPRVAAAQTLANAQHPALSPEMSARIQAKMLAAHRQKMGRQRTLRPSISLVYRWAVVVAAAVAIFSAVSIPAVGSSLPGEFWYPIKRNVESIEVLAATSPSARAEVHLIQAERRINEVQSLLQQRVFDTELMIDARTSLTSYEQSVQETGTSLSSEESRATGVTESIALLLQEAEQMQLITGDQVVALIPTVIAVSTVPSDAVMPTVAPSATFVPTQTSSPTPSATPLPTEVPVTASVQPTQGSVLEPSATHEPTFVPTDTATAAPVFTDTPTATDTPQPTATSTAQQPIETMYALENTNVRSLPGRNQPIITILQQGDAVEVIGEDDTGKWWHIRLVDGRSGWVAKFLLGLDKPIIAPITTNENNGSNNSNGGGNSGNGGDFGCENPGNYCNAPGQTGTQPTPSNGNNNGNGNGNGNGNSGGGKP